MDNKLKIGASLGIAAVIAAGGGYYLLNSNEQTPELAIQTVEQSIANHNKADFYKVVNLDSVIDYSYDGIIEGLTDSDKTMTADAHEAIKKFTQMLRAPLMLSLKSAVDSYVATGNFNENENAGIKELLIRTGIDKIEYRGVDYLQINPENENEATANIRIYQPEIAQELSIGIILNRNSEGNWQIVRVLNFQDFVDSVNKVRRVQLDKYLEQTAEINSRHDTAIREAEQKYASVLSLGTVGQESIQSDLRALMLDVVKKDWELRKQELFSLPVPQGAETLQNLRIQICDLEIGYAEDYVQWMEDKKASTIKSAEEKQRQSENLKAEAAALARRLAN